MDDQALARGFVGLLVMATSMTGAGGTSLAASYGGCQGTVSEQIINVTPVMDYRSVVLAAQPGDRIVFAAGDYSNGLSLYDLHGSEDRCIVLEGADDGASVFVGAPLNGIRNVVQIRNSSYLVLRQFRFDGAGTNDIDAIKSEFTTAGSHANPWSHHITIEDVHIHDFSGNQQQVGISTKAPAWNWVVRGARIERVGTGMYFGDSDGGDHFVGGLIEYNLLLDSVGYNAQIKHQDATSRPSGVGYESLPDGAQTVIRHNVFSKGDLSSMGGSARPNLLLGAQPLSGPGATDQAWVYGNLFFDNPTGFESLLQAEGNLAVYSNLFANPQGPAVLIRPQNGDVRQVRVFRNTVVASTDGIRLGGVPNAMFSQDIAGNVVFADAANIVGGDQRDNLTGALGQASTFLENPQGTPDGSDLNLYPTAALSDIGPIALPDLSGLIDPQLDYDGRPFAGGERGAYRLDRPVNERLPELDFKPQPASTLGIIFVHGFEGDRGRRYNRSAVSFVRDDRE